jgi:spore germination protein YaaH
MADMRWENKGMRTLVAGLAMMLAVPAFTAKKAMTFGGWVDVYPDTSLLMAHPELFTSISFGMYGIQKDGSLKRSNRVPNREEAIKWAHQHGVKVFVTLGCGKKDVPDCITGHALERCLKDVVAVCGKYGFDGVDVDIEELNKSARTPFTLFIAGLRGALKGMKKPRLLSVTAQSLNNAKEEADSFLDYVALGRLADEVRVMHYNCPWGEPGPIMPRAVFIESVAYARSRIPAEKYVAAVPWFGVDWNTKDGSSEDILWQMTEKETGISSLDELVRTFGGSPAWREPEGELSFSYTRDGERHEVWVADAKSFDWMVDEIRKAGAAGIYAYQLEYASPDVIPIIRKKVLGKAK